MITPKTAIPKTIIGNIFCRCLRPRASFTIKFQSYRWLIYRFISDLIYKSLSFLLPGCCKTRRSPCVSKILLSRSIVSSNQEKSFGANPTYFRAFTCRSDVMLRGLKYCQILKKINTIQSYKGKTNP